MVSYITINTAALRVGSLLKVIILMEKGQGIELYFVRKVMVRWKILWRRAQTDRILWRVMSQDLKVFIYKASGIIAYFSFFSLIKLSVYHRNCKDEIGLIVNDSK